MIYSGTFVNAKKTYTIGSQYWTDYPFTGLGDIPYTKVPIRQVTLVSFDEDRYCEVLVEGQLFEVKLGYLYNTLRRMQ